MRYEREAARSEPDRSQMSSINLSGKRIKEDIIFVQMNEESGRARKWKE